MFVYRCRQSFAGLFHYFILVFHVQVRLFPDTVIFPIMRLVSLFIQGISEPEFYGDLVYRFRKIVGKSNFSEQFRKLINLYKRIGYSVDIMRQTACLVVNPIIVDGCASLFNCTTAVRASDSMMASS